MRAVYLSEDDVEKFKHIAEFLRNQGAGKAAGFVSSLVLSWQLAKPLDMHDLDPHSRKVAQ